MEVKKVEKQEIIKNDLRVVVDEVVLVEVIANLVEVGVEEMVMRVEVNVDVIVVSYVVEDFIGHFVIHQVIEVDFDEVEVVPLQMVEVVQVVHNVGIASNKEEVKIVAIINSVGSIIGVIVVMNVREIIYVDQVKIVIINSIDYFLSVIMLLEQDLFLETNWEIIEGIYEISLDLVVMFETTVMVVCRILVNEDHLKEENLFESDHKQKIVVVIWIIKEDVINCIRRGKDMKLARKFL